MRFEWTATDGGESGRGRQAAHGFVLRADSLAIPVAITAHHVVERTSGQTGLAIAGQVRAARLVSGGASERTTPLGAMIPLSGARTIAGGSWDRDVVLDREGRVAGLNAGTVVMTAERWAAFRSRFEGCCRAEGVGGVVGIAVGSRALRRHLAAALR